MTTTIHYLTSGSVDHLHDPDRRWTPIERRDYAEASYFDGFHFQHIADWLEHSRLTRAERVHAAYRRRHSNIAEFWK